MSLFFRFWGIIEITYRFKLYPILHFPLSIAALNCSLVILSGTDIALFTCVFLLLCFLLLCFLLLLLFCSLLFVFRLFSTIANLPPPILYIFNYYFCVKDMFYTLRRVCVVNVQKEGHKGAFKMNNFHLRRSSPPT